MEYAYKDNKFDIVFKTDNVYNDLEKFFSIIYDKFYIEDERGFRKEIENLMFSIDKTKINREDISNKFYSIFLKYSS